MKALAWWLGIFALGVFILGMTNQCDGRYLLNVACYGGQYPRMLSYILVALLAIPMWALHERFGWFVLWQSRSDVPHFAVHPRDDRI